MCMNLVDMFYGLKLFSSIFNNLLLFFYNENQECFFLKGLKILGDIQDAEPLIKIICSYTMLGM